jgi:hypothetical protein
MNSPVRSAYSRALLYPAALLTLGAPIIHSLVVAHHLQEYLPFGLFFIVVGAAQVALAGAIVVWPSRKLFAWAAVGTLAVLALYAVSRTVGLPFGPSEQIAGIATPFTIGTLSGDFPE